MVAGGACFILIYVKTLISAFFGRFRGVPRSELDGITIALSVSERAIGHRADPIENRPVSLSMNVIPPAIGARIGMAFVNSEERGVFHTTRR